MTSSNQDAFFDGEFYEENSFLVLAKGEELSAHSSANSSLAHKSVESQNSHHGTGDIAPAAEDQTGQGPAPKPLPRTNTTGTGCSSVQAIPNNNMGIEEPISSHFGRNQAQGTSAGFARSSVDMMAVAERMKKCAIDQPEVSLASIISSSSSMTASEADSLEESLKLIHILKTENEGLKEILAQRNETLRDEIKSIHTTSAMYESKHADQLQKYDSCVKAIAELRAENSKLKEQLTAVEQARDTRISNEANQMEKLEQHLKDKEYQIQSHQDEIQRCANVVKDCEAQIRSLDEQLKIQKNQNDTILQERDAIQFELTDARITIANLTDELKKSQAGGTSQVNSSAINNDHLESALRVTRLHLTNMKEDNDRKNTLLSTLTAQIREYEANFKKEHDEKNEFAETLSLLQIELEETKAELVKKSEELEKLHHTHLVLANEHLNRSQNRENTIPSPAGNDEFVFINRRQGAPPPNVREEQVQTNPPLPSAPVSVAQNPGGAAASPPAQQVQEVPTGTCPLCFKKFASADAVIRHASNCGVTLLPVLPGSNPFVFP